jgi:hypothetical protein
MKTKTIIQWVVQTSTKLSGWGWESYHKTEAEAQARYDRVKKDKAFETVRIYKETV